MCDLYILYHIDNKQNHNWSTINQSFIHMPRTSSLKHQNHPNDYKLMKGWFYLSMAQSQSNQIFLSADILIKLSYKKIIYLIRTVDIDVCYSSNDQINIDWTTWYILSTCHQRIPLLIWWQLDTYSQLD